MSESSIEVSQPLSSKARRQMIEAMGTLFQLLGLPRSTGQIYGLLYLSSRPLALDDLAEMLSISKGSASMGTRQLASWGAIRAVWVPGNRRDYFQATEDFRNLVQGSYSEFVKPKLNSSERRLARILEDLEADQKDGVLSKEEYRFCRERLKSIEKLQKRVLTLAPLAAKLLD